MLRDLALPLASLLALGACSSDPPPKQTRSVAEARAPDVEAVRPAPEEPPPAAPPVVEPVTARAPVDLETALYNRVLARAEGPVDLEELKAAISAATGAQVADIRKGALGLLSIRFAPVEPARDADAQSKLVRAIEEMKRFRAVEPEKVMKAK